MASPKSLKKLIESFGGFPGVGEKTAERLAHFILHTDKSFVDEFVTAIQETKTKVLLCEQCRNFTEEKLCSICGNTNRQKQFVCIVERPGDVEALETTGSFQGVYFVLHGNIAPLEGSGPDQLRINHLLHQLASNQIKEVLIATNNNVEGDATAHYLTKLLREKGPKNLKLTRLATGLPVGGALTYADAGTLAQAFHGRMNA